MHSGSSFTYVPFSLHCLATTPLSTYPRSQLYTVNAGLYTLLPLAIGWGTSQSAASKANSNIFKIY